MSEVPLKTAGAQLLVRLVSHHARVLEGVDRFKTVFKHDLHL